MITDDPRVGHVGASRFEIDHWLLGSDRYFPPNSRKLADHDDHDVRSPRRGSAE